MCRPEGKSVVGKGREYMGIYRPIIGIAIIGTFWGLIWSNSVTAYAIEDNLVRYDLPSKEQNQYNIFTEDIGIYEVCEGDSLWRISEKLLGKGENYTQFIAQNADVITNPNLIYPKMQLHIKRNVYVKKRMGVNGIKRQNINLERKDRRILGFWNLEKCLRTVRCLAMVRQKFSA